MNKVGGHLLNQHDLSSFGHHPFAREPYEYYHQKLKPGAKLEFSNESIATIYVLNSVDGKLREGTNTTDLRTQNVIQIEGQACTIETGAQPLEVFVAGVNKAPKGPRSIRIYPEQEAKKVEKPWGYEIWLNGEHPEYAFKKIFLKAGTRTSLQYHRMKRETNLIFSGDAKMHYKTNESVDNDKVTPQDVGQWPLNPVTSLDVFPMGLHRIEALSDVMLYEVSTPHLDDVIRVSDDTKRPDGRINKEHS